MLPPIDVRFFIPVPLKYFKRKQRVGEEHEVTEKLPISSRVLPDRPAKQKSLLLVSSSCPARESGQILNKENSVPAASTQV